MQGYMNSNGAHPLYGQGYQNFKQAVLMVINIILTHRAQGIWYNTFIASDLSKLIPYSDPIFDLKHRSVCRYPINITVTS